MSWETFRLGDLYDVFSGLSKPREEFGHGFPFLTFKDVFYNYFIPEQLGSLANTSEKERAKYSILRGDVFLTRTSETVDELGMSCVALKDYPEATFNGFTKRLRKKTDVKVKVDSVFIGYYLRSQAFRQQVNAISSITTRASLNATQIDALEVRLPKYDEQVRIGEMLKPLDDKIELNRRMNGTLEALAQAVFKEWFVEKAEEGWAETSLVQQVEVAKGLSYKGSGLADAGRPMHNLNSIYEFGRYKYEGIKWYTGEFKERHLCKAGDVIVANTEQGFDHLLIGSAAIVPKRFGDEGLFTHHIYRVRPLATSYLTNHFLYLLLSHPAVREQVQGYTNGTTVNSLAKEGLERPTFKLPPKALVEKFDAVVAPLYARQEANYEETQTLTALRDTLLPKLMRGEVRVKASTSDLRSRAIP